MSGVVTMLKAAQSEKRRVEQTSGSRSSGHSGWFDVDPPCEEALAFSADVWGLFQLTWRNGLLRGGLGNLDARADGD